jgi:uncharacterized protein YndB with AHSA1/START domain
MPNVKIHAQQDRELVMTRVFDAPLHLVYRALTEPALIQRWLLGPDDWSMPVCEVDLRVGGKYRYVWQNNKTGEQMGMGGVYKEIVPNEKIVATELFDDAWYPGEGLNTTSLSQSGDLTTMRVVMQYVSREARDGVLHSPMESGVDASYNRLADMLPSL